MSGLERRTLAKRHSAQGTQDQTFRQAGGDKSPCITILLCTFNGALFLDAQLASLERQTHRNWSLIVSDDGSEDATLAIIDDFARRVANTVEVRSGPRCRPAANFMSLAAAPTIKGDYFAFCDQDDIWHPEKLASALAWLQSVDADKAVVYGARTRLVDADNKPLGYAPHFPKQPSFANALAQSIAGANTMLFNKEAKRLFESAGALDVISHDWWAYQLVCGSGGLLFYDSRPHVDYRQPASNWIGCNRGLRAQWKRFRMVLKGGFARWNDVNLRALDQSRHLLTGEAKALLDDYAAMRSGTFVTRLSAFARSPIRRQTVVGNLALLAAIVFKRL